ncbi:hypothetical protein AB4166_22690 [Vibrio splendidus]|uniref:hypothetical protein n=1 Tax=Vibrio splendidus TaxID=29497 RepID=UPI0008090B85|nr:hypothetical protein [Vibrio splendidus]PMK14002.1 hypothetical protein BCU08_22960 [Vibrio splendidus]PMO42862.1 hypothetical protein BCT09_20955 [Vibrio splendidus]PTP59575.1 hypothetical protein CWO01_19280 [Vibrio splendidus]SBS67587.1 hypothetical protein VHE8714_03873 [Vibrio splendidus]
MTGIYDLNPMPHTVDIICPCCGEHVVFEFSEVVKISLKKDVEYFEKSDIFEYCLFRDSYGHNWHGAMYFANLHGCSIDAIKDLPEGYKATDWSHSRYLTPKSGGDIGSYSCNSCYSRKIHILNWPEDAFYSLSYKGEILWAFNRESAVDLKNYIQSTERNRSDYQWESFLLHVPTIFKKKNARGFVVKGLDRRLAL